MAILFSVFVYTLLTSCCLAAPTWKGWNTRPLQKRGFRTPARRYVPEDIIVRRQSGGAAEADSNGGGWVVTANIGGQDVTLNIDTGSADLWTASTLLSLDQQLTVTTGQIYDPTQSSTLRYLNGSSFSINYVDGSGASGPMGTDTITIGSASVLDMPFGVCNSLVYGSSSDGTRDTDGPVGLALSDSSAGTPTFMSALEPYVDELVFSSYFRTDDSGWMTFGYSDDSAYSGDLTTVPISNTDGQWVNQGVQFGSGGQVFSPGPVDMDFDSGTTTLSIPADAASEYFALVGNGSIDPNSGLYTYSCGSELPDFDFAFIQVSSGPTTVTIPGSNLVNGGDNGSGTCFTWIAVTDGRANAGLPFYISKYMIWNQGDPSLSFADQA